MPTKTSILYSVFCINLRKFSQNTKYKILNTKYRKAFGFTIKSAGRLGTFQSCQRRSSDIRRKLGFTLIELLVVISIISLLVATATVSWTNAQRKSRDAKRKSDLKGIQQTLELYFQTNGKYPDTGGSGLLRCNVGAAADINWSGSFTCNGATYMNPLPKETVFTGANEVYFYSASGTPPTSYTLSAKLENQNDPEIAAGALPCTPQSSPTRNYCVINP